MQPVLTEYLNEFNDAIRLGCVPRLIAVVWKRALSVDEVVRYNGYDYRVIRVDDDGKVFCLLIE